MIKEKRCSGKNKAHGFEACGKMTNVSFLKHGLCTSCYPKFLLNDERGKVIMEKAMLKASKPRLQQEKNKSDLQDAEKFKKERDKLNYLLVNVRNVCHAFIRKRDEFKPCISCGIPYNSNFQAGHFYKAELFSNLRFNEFNISGQCPQCNLRKEGNESGYRVGLIQRYGQEFVNKLDALAQHYKKNTFSWEREELEEIRKYYQLKIKNK